MNEKPETRTIERKKIVIALAVVAIFASPAIFSLLPEQAEKEMKLRILTTYDYTNDDWCKLSPGWNLVTPIADYYPLSASNVTNGARCMAHRNIDHAPEGIIDIVANGNGTQVYQGDSEDDFLLYSAYSYWVHVSETAYSDNISGYGTKSYTGCWVNFADFASAGHGHSNDYYWIRLYEGHNYCSFGGEEHFWDSGVDEYHKVHTMYYRLYHTNWSAYTEACYIAYWSNPYGGFCGNATGDPGIPDAPGIYDPPAQSNWVIWNPDLWGWYDFNLNDPAVENHMGLCIWMEYDGWLYLECHYGGSDSPDQSYGPWL